MSGITVLVIGAAGMIGRKFLERVAADGRLGGRDVGHLVLHDVVPPVAPAGWTGGVTVRTGNIADAQECAHVVAARPDIIVHLAAVVSGEAETDFDKGYAINLDGTRNLVEAIRKIGEGYCPRLVFTSSIAVFGAPLPDPIPDDFHLTPLTSYGAQKAMGELFVNDYTRRGFLDGVSIRLPTICVRPGRPNKAASGFFSGIIREPLAGEEAVLPVADDVRHPHASPRAAVGFLVRAAEIDGAEIGPNRALTMPGLSVSVAEQIAALEKVAGPKVAARIRREPDPFIARIVSGWARGISGERARRLGFRTDASFEAIVRTHIDDDRGGAFVA